LTLFDDFEQFKLVVVEEGGQRRKQDEHDHARAPKITRFSVGLVFEHFGGHVGERATVRAGELVLLQLLGEAEVGELDLDVGVALANAEDVVELDVAMDDPVLVAVLDRVENLEHHVSGFALLELVPVNHALTQIATFHDLKHKTDVLFVLLDSQDPNDVGVIELHEKVDLVLD